MMKVSFLKTCMFVFLGALSASGEEVCGDAKVLSGSSCSNLVVLFHLRDCGGSQSERAKVFCEKERAGAILRKDSATFFIPLREISPGVWALVGTLRKYPRDWVPENKESAQIIFRQNLPEKSKTNTDNPTLEVGGQFRFRIEENRKRNPQPDAGFSSLRLRTHFQFRPHSSLEFELMPQAVHILGQPELLPSTSSANSLNSLSGSNRDPSLSFHQAFGEVQLGKLGRAFLGRQMFSYGEEVLVGTSDWENPGRSFDGVRLRLEKEAVWWDLFSVKLWEGQSQDEREGDKDFHGTYLSWGHPLLGLRVEPYFFWLRDHLGSLKQNYTVGVFSTLELASLEIKAEISGQWGEQPGQQAWIEMGSAEIFRSRFRLSGDGFWSSENFNPLFPSVHHRLGWADVLGRRNLAGLGITLGWDGFPGVDLVLRGLHFLRVNTGAPPYSEDGLTPLSFSSSSAQDLGSEVDLRAEIMLVPAARLQSAISVFFPGSPLRPQLGDSMGGRLETSLVATF